jgi:hypothetical protein
MGDSFEVFIDAMTSLPCFEILYFRWRVRVVNVKALIKTSLESAALVTKATIEEKLPAMGN